jgi:hypothetical protein
LADLPVAALVKSMVPASTPTRAEPGWDSMNQSASTERTDAVPTAVDTSNVEGPPTATTTARSRPRVNESLA